MGIFASAASELRTLPTSSPRNPAYWLTRLFQGDPTASGVRVTDESALAVTTVSVVGSTPSSSPSKVRHRENVDRAMSSWPSA